MEYTKVYSKNRVLSNVSCFKYSHSYNSALFWADKIVSIRGDRGRLTGGVGCQSVNNSAELVATRIKKSTYPIYPDNLPRVRGRRKPAVLSYLEETRPQRALMPQDVHKRAKVREICEVIASGIQPLQNLTVLIYVGEEKKREWAQHWIHRGLRAVEKLLSSSAGKYCVGDDISVADCCLIPQVFNARRFHVDLRPFPIVLRIDRELENHPAFRAAHCIEHIKYLYLYAYNCFTQNSIFVSGPS
ncbi:probable maleylacetoacetate isomerase 2 [Diaphorina citri]|uniref:Probable maleylacetoacetate isomerase 2 n=1 Tax=Diaphorina citri TaxID=121845 RepID=A0A3Q0IIH6_DIACI|nr:probable maleylacetoacetate isomerase 2 [Diaphorina citri]